MSHALHGKTIRDMNRLNRLLRAEWKRWHRIRIDDHFRRDHSGRLIVRADFLRRQCPGKDRWFIQFSLPAKQAIIAPTKENRIFALGNGEWQFSRQVRLGMSIQMHADALSFAD